MIRALNTKHLLGYGIADAGQALIGTLIGFYQLYFLTDVIRLPLGKVAGLFFLTKILDTVTFPFFGLVVDRMGGRTGKLRPWLGWLIVPFLAASSLLFAFDKNWSAETREIYTYIVVSFFVVISGLLSVVYAGLLSSIADLASDRAKLSTIRFAFAFGASTIATFSIQHVVDYFGGKESGGFYYVALIFSLISSIALCITYSTTIERRCDRTVPNVETFSGIWLLFKTKAFVAALIATLFTGIFVTIKSQMTLYFITYVMQRKDIANLMLATGTISCALGVVGIGFFINRIDRQKLFVYLMALNAIFIAAIYFIDKNNTQLIIISHSLNSVLGGACAPVIFSIYSDIVDYLHHSKGYRSPALINSIAMLGGRIGGSLGMILTPLGLAYFNYRPDVAQLPSSLHGIVVMFTIVPAALAGLSAIAMIAYKISNRQAEETSHQLSYRIKEFA